MRLARLGGLMLLWEVTQAAWEANSCGLGGGGRGGGGKPIERLLFRVYKKTQPEGRDPLGWPYAKHAKNDKS